MNYEVFISFAKDWKEYDKLVDRLENSNDKSESDKIACLMDKWESENLKNVVSGYSFMNFKFYIAPEGVRSVNTVYESGIKDILHIDSCRRWCVKDWDSLLENCRRSLCHLRKDFEFLKRKNRKQYNLKKMIF